jgi:hypothetical protein
MRRWGLTALACALLALALGACGSGRDASPTPAAESGPRVALLAVSGGGSAQFRVKGGDNSIANYGEEASGRELRDAAAVTHGYFAALVTENWAAACKLLSAKLTAAIEHLAARAHKGKAPGCAGALGMLFDGVSAAEGREATAVDAVSLRAEGTVGFLLYRGAKGKPYFVNLAREDGRWVVDGLSPTPLG